MGFGVPMNSMKERGHFYFVVFVDPWPTKYTAIYVPEKAIKKEGKFLMSGNIYQHIIRKICIIGLRNVLFTYGNITSKYTF